MTATHTSFADLTDDQLLADVKRRAGTERHATAALIRSLMELDARRLYLSEGCASLFTYCTQVLHLAEGSAYNRIEAARAARRFPLILDALEDGSLTLTSVRLLAPHLTVDNHQDVLASARHKRKRDVEHIVAALHPQPAVPATVRKLPVSGGSPTPPQTRPAESSTATPPVAATSEPAAPPVRTSAPRAAVMPLAPDRYKLQVTISGDTYAKFRRVQDLLRHTVPIGDPGDIIDRALTVLLAEVERRRCAATTRPRTQAPQSRESRQIPAAVRRQVWTRDGSRCAFVGTRGRCKETAFLEFHHVQPYAAGGDATAANIQLRCRSHNQFEARLFFAHDGSDLAREAAAPWW